MIDDASYQNSVGISSDYKTDGKIDTNKIAFWAGKSKNSKESAPFRVSYEGFLHASSADITGKITSSSGNIGGWEITKSSLKAGGIEISSSGTIKSNNWSINGSGNATFNDITCKGKFTGLSDGGASGGTLGGGSGGYRGSGVGSWGTSNGMDLDEDYIQFANGEKLYSRKGHIGSSADFGCTTLYCACLSAGGYYGAGFKSNFAGDVTINGGLFVGGKDHKEKVATTEHYGTIGLDAFETLEPMFADSGEGIIGEDGLCYLWLDPIFLEVTSRHTNPRVFLTKYGLGDVYYDEKNSTESYLLIKGTPNLKFSWEVRCLQKYFYNSSRYNNVEYNLQGNEGYKEILIKQQELLQTSQSILEESQGGYVTVW